MTPSPANKFKHVILTRFDLRSSKWQRDKTNQATLSAEWYRNRFLLFEKYCLQSVRSQTNRCFHWILLMDERTDQKHRSHLLRLIKKDVQIHLVLSRGFEGWLDKIKAKINTICSEDADGLPKFILTTRLDNDDCLHHEFVQEVQQKAAALTEKTIIDATNGYYVNPRTLSVVPEHLSNNPFLSLFEPFTQLETILVKMHEEWADFSPRISISRPLWVVIIHQRNLQNRTPVRWHASVSKIAAFTELGIPERYSLAQELGVTGRRLINNGIVLMKRIYYSFKRALAIQVNR